MAGVHIRILLEAPSSDSSLELDGTATTFVSVGRPVTGEHCVRDASIPSDMILVPAQDQPEKIGNMSLLDFAMSMFAFRASYPSHIRDELLAAFVGTIISTFPQPNFFSETLCSRPPTYKILKLLGDIVKGADEESFPLVVYVLCPNQCLSYCLRQPKCFLCGATMAVNTVNYHFPLRYRLHHLLRSDMRK